MIKVLVVDDSDVLRRISVFNLKRAGFDVYEAVDGIDGIEKMKELKPNVVILDVMMPRLDGFGVLKEMQNDDALKGINVVMLTAKGGDDDAEHALKLGAKKFLTKPFSPKKLVEVVNELAGEE